MTLVFVYGTLKKGQPNSYRMLEKKNGRVKYLGRGQSVKPYPLIIATKNNIPFMLNDPGRGQRVKGEIYEVDENTLKFLDGFESCPDLYQRSLIKIEVEEWTHDDDEEDKPKPGSIIETFVYNTNTYKPEWLQYPTYDSYDTYGEHQLMYVCREDRSSDEE